MGPSFMDVMPFARLPDNDDDDDDDKKMKNIKRKIVYYSINIECFKPQCIDCSFSSVKILDSRLYVT